jgi:acyl carrier protein
LSAENSQTIARRLLASAVQMETDEIPDDAAIGRLGSWNSLAHMRLIMAIEEHMGSPLEPDAVVSIASLADVIKILDESGARS